MLQARPGYQRANSNLTQIKERPNERPVVKTLTSHNGVNIEKADVDDSLQNPPTEYLRESHPAASTEDNRFKETEKIARDVQEKSSGTKKLIEDNLPSLEHGESKRQEQAAKSTSNLQSKQLSQDKETLLLVEDNLINQKVLRRQLQSRGFEVFTANNGQEAIDAVAKRGQIANNNPNDRNFFDIILMDQEMPIKDGNAATQEIRQLQQEGKAGYSHIIGVSANVRTEQTNSMREAGMDDVISKPFKVDDLVKRIKSIIMEDGPSYDTSQEKDPSSPNARADEETDMLEPSHVQQGPELGGHAHIELGDEALKDSQPSNADGKKESRKGCEGQDVEKSWS
jgi:CheY-like chemotaxis protein